MGCEHEWGDEYIVACGNAPSAKSTLTTNAGKGPLPGDKYHHSQAKEASQGQFCRKCGAWLGSLGLEPTVELYVEHIVEVFREVRRVLRDDGTLWLNMGDSYAGSWGNYMPGGYKGKQRPQTEGGKRWDRPAYQDTAFLPPTANVRSLKPKDLIGIPWRVALALQADGWWLRSDIIWAKGVSFLPDYAGSCMPESVQDRPTKGHEYVFLLSKSRKYFYDIDAVREPLAFNRWSMSNKLGSSNRDIKTGQGAPGQSPHSWERKGHSGYFDGDGNPLFNPAGRNLRTVWVINPKPFSGAHFAVFPPRLVEPMIKAGTSERGACPECGKAWMRVVEKSTRFEGGSGKAGTAAEDIGGKWGENRHGKNILLGPVVDVKTIGWRPACSCYDYFYQTEFPKAHSPRKRHQHDLSGSWWRRVKKRPGLPHWEVVPCIVLDPFAGAGTTLMVADGLGQDWFGIDIKAAYIKMALGRIAEDRKKRAQLELF